MTHTRAHTPSAADIQDNYDVLLAGDPELRAIADEHGRPDPFHWSAGGVRTPTNFAALLLHIASQQISTTVAVVLYDRLVAAARRQPTATDVAGLGPDRLHSLGLSGAKATAMVDIARLQNSGVFDLENLDALTDEQVVEALTAARGVGRWTAEMFLLHQLCRPDVLPAGDLGIRHAAMRVWRLPAVPRIEQVRELGARWSPRRSYAAALLWTSLAPVRSAAVEGGRKP